jgi:hypothetical protein
MNARALASARGLAREMALISMGKFGALASRVQQTVATTPSA